MTKSDPQLADRRADRDRARALFNSRLARAKIDLAPSALKRRVATEAQRTTLSIAHQATEIANDSRGIVVATAAAVTIWLARRPILAGANRLVFRFQTRKSVPKLMGYRLKLLVDDYWQRLKDYADD